MYLIHHSSDIIDGSRTPLGSGNNSPKDDAESFFDVLIQNLEVTLIALFSILLLVIMCTVTKVCHKNSWNDWLPLTSFANCYHINSVVVYVKHVLHHLTVVLAIQHQIIGRKDDEKEEDLVPR